MTRPLIGWRPQDRGDGLLVLATAAVVTGLVFAMISLLVPDPAAKPAGPGPAGSAPASAPAVPPAGNGDHGPKNQGR